MAFPTACGTWAVFSNTQAAWGDWTLGPYPVCLGLQLELPLLGCDPEKVTQLPCVLVS